MGRHSATTEAELWSQQLTLRYLPDGRSVNPMPAYVAAVNAIGRPPAELSGTQPDAFARDVPLTRAQRLARYSPDEYGADALTPRQRRRLNHKANRAQRRTK